MLSDDELKSISKLTDYTGFWCYLDCDKHISMKFCIFQPRRFWFLVNLNLRIKNSCEIVYLRYVILLNLDNFSNQLMKLIYFQTFYIHIQFTHKTN